MERVDARRRRARSRGEPQVAKRCTGRPVVRKTPTIRAEEAEQANEQALEDRLRHGVTQQPQGMGAGRPQPLRVDDALETGSLTKRKGAAPGTEEGSDRPGFEEARALRARPRSTGPNTRQTVVDEPVTLAAVTMPAPLAEVGSLAGSSKGEGASSKASSGGVAIGAGKTKSFSAMSSRSPTTYSLSRLCGMP